MLKLCFSFGYSWASVIFRGVCSLIPSVFNSLTTTSSPTPKPTVILVPKVYSYNFPDFCGEIWCGLFKYRKRNQQKYLEIRKRGHHTE